MSDLKMALTLDVDWAPDFVIEHTASILLDAGVKATWFVTHDSPAIRELRNHPDLFELGIHPNFHAGSTQGKTPEDIVRYCATVVPEARVYKSHALLESTHLLEVVMKYSSVKIDMTPILPEFCLPRPVRYEWKHREIWRLSCCWEDNFQFCCRKPVLRLEQMAWLEHGGIAAFTFHPIHICLNASRYEDYEALKALGPMEDLTDASVRAVRGKSQGVEDVFRELVAHASGEGCDVRASDTLQNVNYS
jgi:hypothetical protein